MTGMVKLARLLGAAFSMSLKRELAYRGHLAFRALMTVVGLGSSLAALQMVFTRTATLGGWSAGEAIALLGTFQVVSGLRETFVEPNMEWFGSQIYDGRLDSVLLRPAPSILQASLGSCAPLALTQSVLGLGLAVVGLHAAGTVPSVGAVLGWLVLLGAGLSVAWAGRLALACLAFWAPRIQLDIVYNSLWQLARYPVDVYRRPLRLVLTYVIPVALISTLPTVTLVRAASPYLVPAAIGLALAAIAAAGLVWRAGLRRYTSATS